MGSVMADMQDQLVYLRTLTVRDITDDSVYRSRTGEVFEKFSKPTESKS